MDFRTQILSCCTTLGMFLTLSVSLIAQQARPVGPARRCWRFVCWYARHGLHGIFRRDSRTYGVDDSVHHFYDSRM